MAKRPLPELKQYRAAHNPPLSQGDLASKLGVSRVTVARWEAGDRRPDIRFVTAVSRMTGIDPAELMGVAS